MLPLPLPLRLPQPPALTRGHARTWARRSDDDEERSADNNEMADADDQMSVWEADEQAVKSKRDRSTAVWTDAALLPHRSDPPPPPPQPPEELEHSPRSLWYAL